MAEKQFERTTAGGISLSRLVIGCNWFSGFSHTSPAADHMITARHAAPESIADILCVYLEYGVDTLLGLVSRDDNLYKAIQIAQEKTGKKIYIIDEPIINVDNTKEAYKEAEAAIKKSREINATFCMPLHSCVEQLLNKNTQTINRLPDYLQMIRDNGMHTGLSAHMPEVIQYTDQNNYDVDLYIQIYNCVGFLMQVEIESVNKIIWAANHPVITIKPCAAGRVTPFVGLNFNFNTIRQQDMVCIGAFTPEEAFEDIEYSMAAIERRQPNIASRTSPLVTSVISGETTK